jgi:hypothetical protein
MLPGCLSERAPQATKVYSLRREKSIPASVVIAWLCRHRAACSRDVYIFGLRADMGSFLASRLVDLQHLPVKPNDQKTPKQFLRERRPERFSDTQKANAEVLDRSTLEYHLSTLTNRNQESDFQNFAFKLAQLTICPNLRPQTGPTGGGDSKADAETFPVSDQLASGWYSGVGRESSSERWAFAFSAMKAWKGKVESDVKKIADTGRGYSQVFFISSQFIPDKKRATVEDELKKKFNFDRVTIYDRNWILDQVFKGSQQDLAVSELRIALPPKQIVEEGPLDSQRRKSLAQAEAQINILLADGSSGTLLVWYAIEAGRLARELELTRADVDGRYRRAIDLADKYGSDRQKIEARYQFAWATFWWQEDFTLFNELYSDVEAFAKASGSAPDLKLLYNLWHLLFMVKTQEKLPLEKLCWNERLFTLANTLENISKSEHMPSAALEARAMLLLQQVTVTYPNVSSTVFTELKEVVENCSGLIGFPLQQTVNLITELGEIISDDKAFDELCEAVASVLLQREGESASAMQLLRRSFQKLEANHCYDAIELAGRSLGSLWKQETQAELLDALYVCAVAYERIGLVWAARGSFLNAASIMVNSFHEHPEPDAFRVGCFSRLKWIELLLGRLPHFFAWHQAEQAVRSLKADSALTGTEDFKLFDGCVGIILLRANLDTLKKLEYLPDVLAMNGLRLSRAALLYALGWEEEVKTELAAPESEDLSEFFLLMRDQPASEDLPPVIDLGDSENVVRSSSLLGVEVRVTAVNSPQCDLIAESFLAALESALATGFREKLIPIVPTIDLTITTDETAPFPFSIHHSETGPGLQCSVRCPSFNPHNLRREDQNEIKNKLLELMAAVVANTAPVSDFKERIARLFGAHGGFDRALNFTSSFVTLGNVLGHNPPTKVADWVEEAMSRYSLKRLTAWDSGLRPKMSKETGQETVSSEDAAARERDEINHKKMAMFSIINMRLWDQANWHGTVYAGDPDGKRPPILAIGFRDVEAGAKIFREWQERFGERDVDNAIRLTIIKGISTKNPAAYRVFISANPSDEAKKGKTHFVMINRSHTMDASSTVNLDRFLVDYHRFKGFFFGYAKFETANGSPRFELVFEDMIIKQELTIRDAWSIGLHENESMGIYPGDDPIIPEGKQNPPVIELLENLRALKLGREQAPR